MAGPNYGLIDNALINKNRAMEGYGAANTLYAQNLENQAAQIGIQNAMAEQAAGQAAGGDIAQYQKNLMALGQGKQSVAIGKAIAETEQSRMKSMLDRLPIQREMAKSMALDPSPQHIMNTMDYQVKMGWMTPQQAQETLKTLSTKSPQELTDYFNQSATKAEDILSTQLRGVEAQTARQRLQFEMDPTRQGQISAAKAGGAETGKSSAQAAANLPSAIQTANEAITLIDEMVGKEEIKNAKGEVIQKATAPHPGFESYVGATWLPGQRFLEGTSAASYEVRQKQIEGQAFLEAFRSLKGGGSITEKEGEKATAAITRMNKASSEKEYIQAARELQQILRTGVENAKKKAARGTVGGGPLPKNKWADALAEFEAQENQ